MAKSIIENNKDFEFGFKGTFSETVENYKLNNFEPFNLHTLWDSVNETFWLTQKRMAELSVR